MSRRGCCTIEEILWLLGRRETSHGLTNNTAHGIHSKLILHLSLSHSLPYSILLSAHFAHHMTSSTRTIQFKPHMSRNLDDPSDLTPAPHVSPYLVLTRPPHRYVLEEVDAPPIPIT